MNYLLRPIYMLLICVGTLCCSSAPIEISKTHMTPLPEKQNQRERKIDLDRAEPMINVDGWELPNIQWEESSSFVLQNSQLRKTGVEIKVFKANSGFPLVVKDRFFSTDLGLGTITLIDGMKYSIYGETFCFKFQYSHGENSGGPTSYFAYYDEDGDGKFETLIFNERNEKGHSVFFGFPHVPLRFQ